MIPRFYDATKGKVFVAGNEVSQYTFAQLRDKIGIVPQKAVLFKGSIADNLRWGCPDATKEQMEEALCAAQALGFVQERRRGLTQ